MRDEIADEGADTDADGNGLVRMLMDGYVGRFRALNGLLANLVADFLAALEGGIEALAGFHDFFPGHVGGGGHQGAGIVGQLAHVVTDRLGLMVHRFFLFGLVAFCSGKFSAAARWAAADEPATFRIEFRPPFGLGTDSRASGSGIQWPSTTRQYS